MSKVIVVLNDVKLKLTLTEELLDKSIAEAVIAPFLGAYNKKKSEFLSVERILGFTVDDGSELSDLTMTSRAVLTSSELPMVTLHAPPSAPSPIGVLVEGILKASADEDAEEWREALHTLRVAVMDEAAKPTGEALPWPKALFETPMVELAAHHACLSASARAKRREWGADSAEAALLLLALLRAEQQKTGAAMCSRDVQAADGVVLALAEPQKLNLPQLRQLSQIAFHLSLLPTEMKECAGALKDSARVALGWVVSAITGPVDHDPVLVAGSASDLFRTLFNLVRTQPPDPKNETAVNECGVLMSLVCDVLRARPKATPAVPELLEAQLASLQIPVVLPEDIGYKALAKEWDSILHLLEPLLHTVEYENQNLDAPVVPMVVLQKIAEASAKAQSEMKQHIFGEEILAKQIDKADPYRPLGESKDWDPNLTLPKDAPLRHHLLKLLTASHYILKRVGGDFLFAVCDDNAEEFVRITGLGGAAGLLQERNLFAAFQHMTTSAASAAEVLEK